jgi:hypothetical protein
MLIREFGGGDMDVSTEELVLLDEYGRGELEDLNRRVLRLSRVLANLIDAGGFTDQQKLEITCNVDMYKVMEKAS